MEEDYAHQRFQQLTARVGEQKPTLAQLGGAGGAVECNGGLGAGGQGDPQTVGHSKPPLCPGAEEKARWRRGTTVQHNAQELAEDLPTGTRYYNVVRA